MSSGRWFLPTKRGRRSRLFRPNSGFGRLCSAARFRYRFRQLGAPAVGPHERGHRAATVVAPGKGPERGLRPGVGAASGRRKSKESRLLLPIVRQISGKGYETRRRQLDGLFTGHDGVNDFGREIGETHAAGYLALGFPRIR